MKRTVTAIANQKGGVGKTAGATNLGEAGARRGNRTLVIDMDGQGNATTMLIGPRPVDHPTAESVFGVIMGESTWEDIIVQTAVEGLHLAPAHLALTQLQSQLEAAGVPAGKERRLAKRLRTLGDYDHILIDCPPALDLATMSAFVAADEIVIPTQLEGASVEGIPKIIHLINTLAENIDVVVPIRAIYPSMTESKRMRLKLERDLLHDLREAFGSIVCRTNIRRSVKVAEAYSNRIPIGQYLPDHDVAADYRELYDEIWGK